MSQRLISPINKGRLTASWKTDAYKNRFGMVHYGVDIISSAGATFLYACGQGEVIATGNDNVLGNFIIIKYYDAYNHVTKKSCDVISRMWHLAKIDVKQGDKVTIDTKIGNYGSTGQYVTGAHLHIEMDTDTEHPGYTPSLTGNTANFSGRNSGANSDTMTNPLEWFHLKKSAPEKQTWSTTNDVYIRPEDKSLPTLDESIIQNVSTDNTANIEGIDVSNHNGKVDWNKVKEAGKKFAFIRLGWAGFAGGIKDNNALDKRYCENIQGALDAGMDVGIYVYSYCKTPEAAKIAALETLNYVKPYNITYPIAFDIESISASEPNGSHYDRMSKQENTDICNAFLNTIADHGYNCVLYTYKSFAENYLDMSQLSDWDLWIAQYSSTCTYNGNYTIWQHHGETGSCPGVTGACDLNTSYIDYAAIGHKPVTYADDLQKEISEWKDKHTEALEEIEFWKSQVIKYVDEINEMKEDVANLSNKYN